MIAVEGVPAKDIRHIYEQAWPWLDEALKLAPDGPDKHDKQSLRRALEASQSQLWIAWDIDQHRCIGAATTNISTPEEYPEAKCVEVPLLGGERFPEWGFRIFDILKRWGLSLGCTHIVGYGRKGWIRLFGFDRHGETRDGVLILVRALKEH